MVYVWLKDCKMRQKHYFRQNTYVQSKNILPKIFGRPSTNVTRNFFQLKFGRFPASNEAGGKGSSMISKDEMRWDQGGQGGSAKIQSRAAFPPKVFPKVPYWHCQSLQTCVNQTQCFSRMDSLLNQGWEKHQVGQSSGKGQVALN